MKIQFSILDFRFSIGRRANKFLCGFHPKPFSDNLKSAIANRKWAGILAIVLVLTLGWARAEAQQTKIARIGVLVPGEAWYEIIDGLRAGLKQLGLAEGKQFGLAIRDWKGDAKVAEQIAKNFEQEKIHLIYSTSTNGTITARRATTEIPIVFCAGTDPVVVGLMDSFARPGGRLTGVYHPSTDLTAKRLEVLKEIVPRLRRIMILYDPRLRTGIEASRFARAAAQQMRLQIIERQFHSVEEFQAILHALKGGEVDAYLAVSDPTASNQAQLIIDTANAKRLPTMFDFLSHVTKGGLASYAVSFHEMGRLSAKYVQRILSGVRPQDLPVEGIDKIELVINLKAAKQIGLTIPQKVLSRADRVIR